MVSGGLAGGPGARGRAARRVTLACAVAMLGVLVVSVEPAAASSVSGVGISADSYVAGNNAAKWTVTFTTSASGGLSGVLPDTVAVTFPAGFDVSGAGVSAVGPEFGCIAPPGSTSALQVVTVTLNGTCSGPGSSAAASITLVGISPSAAAYPQGGFSVATSKDTTPTTSTSGTITITAAPPVTRSVTYDTQTSSNSATTGVAPVDPSSPYANGATVTVLGNSGGLALSGYTFAGWCTTNTATNPTLCAAPGVHHSAGGSFVISANVTLYSQWTLVPTTYPVTYSTQTSSSSATTSGAAPTDLASPYTGGATVTVLANSGNLALTGYTFANWCTTNTSADPTLCTVGTRYAPGDMFAISSATTLYPQFTLNQPPPSLSWPPSFGRIDATAFTGKTTPERDRTAKYDFTSYGRLIVPRSVGAAGCTGKVLISFRLDSKTLSVRTASLRLSLATGKCTWTSDVTFLKGRLLKLGPLPMKMTVSYKFGGNDFLNPMTAPSQTVIAG